MSDKLGTSCLEWKVSEVRERMRFLRGRPAWHLLATKVAKALNVNSGDKSGIFPSLTLLPAGMCLYQTTKRRPSNLESSSLSTSMPLERTSE